MKQVSYLNCWHLDKWLAIYSHDARWHSVLSIWVTIAVALIRRSRTISTHSDIWDLSVNYCVIIAECVQNIFLIFIAFSHLFDPESTHDDWRNNWSSAKLWNRNGKWFRHSTATLPYNCDWCKKYPASRRIISVSEIRRNSIRLIQ